MDGSTVEKNRQLTVKKVLYSFVLIRDEVWECGIFKKEYVGKGYGCVL